MLAAAAQRLRREGRDRKDDVDDLGTSPGGDVGDRFLVAGLRHRAQLELWRRVEQGSLSGHDCERVDSRFLVQRDSFGGAEATTMPSPDGGAQPPFG